MDENIENIKEKFQGVFSIFKGVEVSEKIAILTTVLAFAFFIAVIFLIVSLVLPKTQVNVQILGPEEAIAGEEITYTVVIKNRGNVVLENPELTFQYPSSSLPEKESLLETVRFESSLYAGQEKTFEFKAQVFGQENENLEAKAWLNYYAKNKFETSRTINLTTNISEVPIELIIDIPKKIAIFPDTESEFILRTRFISLIDKNIENLKLLITYPEELNIKESIPLKEEDYWRIEKMEGFAAREVEMVGFFPEKQKIGEDMNFNAQLFVHVHGRDVLLKEYSTISTTFNPNFKFTQLINSQENYFPAPGETLHYEIYFKNIQNEPLSNLVLSTVLEGNLYSVETIETPTGSFHRGGRSITWTGEKIPQLRYLTPGEEGKVEFWVQLKEDYKPQDITELNASVRNRVILGDFEQEFRSRASSRIKLSQEGYFRDPYRFFENQGPNPPEVNETTHYTIVWKLENYYNSIKDVQIKATLPQNVVFRSVKSTKGEMQVITDPFKAESPYYPIIPRDFRFERPLFRELRNDIEVRYLQTILKKEVPHVYRESVPITGYFGPITFESVKAFQEKYRRDILNPQGIQMGTGYVDELTRTKLNRLLMEGLPLGSSEVVWQIGNVGPGIGVFEEELVAAFQIAFTPQMADKGKVMTLISEATISAKDEWTGATLFSAESSIDTALGSTRTGAGEVR